MTIDIGGNDIVFCSDADLLRQRPHHHGCQRGHHPRAVCGPRPGPDVPFYGMTYFDPLLGNWLDGASGQAEAEATVPLLDELNAHLVADYSAVGAPSADVAGAFASDDFTLVDSPWGTIPRNVYNACRWLDITCTPGQPEGFGDDANADGYQVIAAAFEAVIAPLPPPPTTTSTTEPAHLDLGSHHHGRLHRATDGAGRRRPWPPRHCSPADLPPIPTAWPGRTRELPRDASADRSGR